MKKGTEKKVWRRGWLLLNPPAERKRRENYLLEKQKPLFHGCSPCQWFTAEHSAFGFLCLLSAFTRRESNMEVLNQQQHLLPQQKPTGRKAKKQVRFLSRSGNWAAFSFFFFFLSRFWGFWFFCWVCFIFLKHLGHSYPSYCRVLYYPTLAVYLCHQTTWVLELAVPFRVFTCI